MAGIQRGLVATIAFGVLAFGSVYPWAYWPLAVAAIALGVRAGMHTHAWSDARIVSLSWALGAVAVAMAVQLVPLPYGLLTAVSPGVDGFLREYQLAYRRPAWHPLSIGPGYTATALGLFVAFAVLLAGLTRAVRYMRIEWLMTQLIGLGVALAVVGIVQRTLADEHSALVYGFWEPTYGGNPFGPFVNRNHFAGWMLMALPPVIGLALAELELAARPRTSAWRIWARWVVTTDASRFLLAAGAVLAMGLSVVLTGSRSGAGGLAVTLAVLGYHVMRRTQSARARLAVGIGIGAFLVGVLVWADPRELIDRFALTTDGVEGRLIAWRDTWTIIQDFPLAGTGLGTYGLAMLVYQTAGRPLMYLQAHNDYLQLAAEGGLLVGIPVLVLLWHVVSVIRRRLQPGDDDVRTRWVRIGAVAGLLGIAAQSLVEFSLQMPGNTLLCVVMLAIAMHRPSRSTGARRV